jgi:hypothetical protein
MCIVEKRRKKGVQLRDNVATGMYIYLILCSVGTFPLKDW